LLLLIQNGVQAEECCQEKRVGSVSYSLLPEAFDGSLPHQCLNTCVYTEKGKSSPKFCFARGDLPTECQSKASPETPGDDCNFNPSPEHVIVEGQRFRFNVEIPFIGVGQGPLVIEMGGTESENADVWLMGQGIAAFNRTGSKYTSCDCFSIPPGNYTMEVNAAVGKWKSPPTIVSIRLHHPDHPDDCRPPHCPSFCPANQFEREKVLGGCNVTHTLQPDEQSYDVQLLGLEGLENGNLTIEFDRNAENITIVQSSKFLCGKRRRCPRPPCLQSRRCTSNSTLPLDDLSDLTVRNKKLDDGNLIDENARWSSPPMIRAYYVDGENLCDIGVPPCCIVTPRPPHCELCPSP